MFFLMNNAHDHIPRPPSCLQCARLIEPPNGARVTVAGLVIVRQRPGSAKGVIFVTLEDETGIANIVIWAKIYERFRRQVIAARLMRVTGRIQREGQVIHVVADLVEDISPLLDELTRSDRKLNGAEAHADEVRRPVSDNRAPGSGHKPRANHPREQAKRLFN